jgi:hypothetical protein
MAGVTGMQTTITYFASLYVVINWKSKLRHFGTLEEIPASYA